ncbi:MAG: NAD(P)-binding protein, partial [Pseudomonadota bacterium]
MSKIAQDEAVGVIIGSGAGGGTMAFELTKAGVPVVLLEAGPYLKPDDYENDEWAAFGQMAWLDARTTSGSWRVAKDFSGTPALVSSKAIVPPP